MIIIIAAEFHVWKIQALRPSDRLQTHPNILSVYHYLYIAYHNWVFSKNENGEWTTFMTIYSVWHVHREETERMAKPRPRLHSILSRVTRCHNHNNNIIIIILCITICNNSLIVGVREHRASCKCTERGWWHTIMIIINMLTTSAFSMDARSYKTVTTPWEM